jgi:hypothetical protein
VSVKVHRLPTPFALVEMANHMQALQLSQLGGSMFGTSVLIHLQQAPDNMMPSKATERLAMAG